MALTVAGGSELDMEILMGSTFPLTPEISARQSYDMSWIGCIEAGAELAIIPKR
jgi:hypothetical protein